MNLFGIIVSIALLGFLAYQDFRYRAISWFLIPLLLLSFFFFGLQVNPISELGKFFVINLGFLVFQMLVLTLYFSLKNKRITNIVNEYIGVGDLLFFIAICAAFSPLNFVLFYTGSIVFSLLAFAVYQILFKSKNREIPLAGIFALVMMMVICVANAFGNISLYDETLFLSFFSIAGIN
jgi:hypothetical protein